MVNTPCAFYYKTQGFTMYLPAHPSPAWPRPSPARPGPAQPSPAQPSPAQPSTAQHSTAQHSIIGGYIDPRRIPHPGPYLRQEILKVAGSPWEAPAVHLRHTSRCLLDHFGVGGSLLLDSGGSSRVCMEYVWNICGMCVEYPWNVYGICME